MIHYTVGIDKNDSSQKAAEQFVESVKRILKEKGSCSVVVPTGGSPKRFFENITEDYRNSPEWEKLTWITLDELYGIKLSHRATFYSYLERNLFTPLQIRNESIAALDSEADDPTVEAKRFASLCQNADIAIIGVGADGHIGMNFPPCDPESSVHLLNLPAHGMPAGSQFKPEESIPTQGITMGMKDILSAEKIMLLVDGSSKAESIKELKSGIVSVHWPVTYLNNHKDVEVYISEDAL